jgi:glucose/arabinose dehydrogenase
MTTRIQARPWLLACAMVLAGVSNIRAAFPALELKPVCEDQLHSVTNICHAGDGSGRLFLCEQHGPVRIFHDGMLLPTPFLNVAAKMHNLTSSYDERGLLGLAFHPDYESAAMPGFRKFYVFYTAPSDMPAGTDPVTGQPNPVNCMAVVAEYQVSLANPNVADLASERIVLKVNKPQFNHNGGQLEFGPDGLLYISFGDGGSSNDNSPGHTGGSNARPNDNLGNSQDKTRLLGKILRIDPLGNNGPGGQYGIPASNPFVGAGGGVREEIYAYGLRNPWRFSFDTGAGGTNRLFCADVGQGNVEEVNLITLGGNYGWHVKEGTTDFFPAAPVSGTAPIDPIGQYAHPGVVIGSPALPQIGISIIGGYVYRGSKIPTLQGKYVFGDYSSTGGAASGDPNGILLGLEETALLSGSFTMTTLELADGNPFSSRLYALGTDEAGEIYVSTKTTPGPVQLDSTNGKPAGSLFLLTRDSSPVTVVLEPSKDNSIFSELPNNASGAGVSLFAGKTIVPSFRRALIAFDLSSIPTDAIVSAAEVVVQISFGQGSNDPMKLHRLNESWGEGTSNSGAQGGQGVAAAAGDATWNSRFHNTTPWTTPGGTFEATASATAVGNTSGPITWASSGLIADVQGWIASPSANHGWIIVGNETGGQTAKRIDSREGTNPASRPKLSLTYSPPSPFTHRETWRNAFFVIGEYVDPQGDPDRDGIPNEAEHAFGFSPLTYNALDSALSVSASPDGAGGTILTITFRRDPRVTDLTYQLQAGAELASWDTIAESVAGAPTTGAPVVSDVEIPGQAPFRAVTVTHHVPAASAQRHFARLAFVRTQ